MNFLESDKNQYIIKHSNAFRNTLLGIGVFLLLGATGAATYFYKQYSNIQNDPSKIAQQQSQSVVDQVGKLIVLPTGETPTVATVTDPSQLGNQAFFANAKVGDKVLLYANAKEAILYDPSINKIVSVAPIDLSDQNAPTVSGSTQTNSGTIPGTK